MRFEGIDLLERVWMNLAVGSGDDPVEAWAKKRIASVMRGGPHGVRPVRGDGLAARLRLEPVVHVRRWQRDDLYLRRGSA
jgi:hypothetical protein